MNARRLDHAQIDRTVEYALEREGDWCQVGQLWKRIPEIPLDQITPSLDRLRYQGRAERHPNGFQWRIPRQESTP